MEINLEELLPMIGGNKARLAAELFRTHRERLNTDIDAKIKDLHVSGLWKIELERAEATLEEWQRQSGRKQIYTIESLAFARLAQEETNTYSNIFSFLLKQIDAYHETVLYEDLKGNGLRESLISEGRKDKKLGVVELTSRLQSLLTFAGSSDYFEFAAVPYGKKSREVLGENTEGIKSFVAEAVAEESARNLQRRFGVHYALAETSAAPRNDVPKSGKKPEVYICGLAGNKMYSEYHVIDTPFRDEFNAHVRELMYGMLKKMYGV